MLRPENIRAVVCGAYQENAYLVCPDDRGDAFIVDPGDNLPALTRALSESGRRLSAIVLTHGHFDHVFGAQFVCDTYHLQPEMCADEVPTYLQAAEQMRMFLHRDFPLTLPSVGITFKDGDLITFGNHRLRVIETPGHTPGGVCFYCEAEKLIFSGDSLFRHEIGRCDLPGGNESQLIRVLKEKILSLPSDVNVLPGHDVATTVGEEKRANRHLL